MSGIFSEKIFLKKFLDKYKFIYFYINMLERELYKLLNLANQKDIIVLTNFRGNKYFFWNLSQKKINEEETLNEKFYILCIILNQISLEDNYIKPYIREKIKSFSNQEKEGADDDFDISKRKINFCEICKKTIFSDAHNLLNVCNNVLNIKLNMVRTSQSDRSGCGIFRLLSYQIPIHLACAREIQYLSLWWHKPDGVFFIGN